jgi:hypothetical protein
MPEAGVASGWQRLQRRLGEQSSPIDWIVWLAASFGVSDQAAAYRLVNLGLIQAVGGTTADAIQEIAENYEMLREAKARLGLSPVRTDAERGTTEVGPAMRARVALALEEGAVTVDGAAGILHQLPEDVYRWVAESGIRLPGLWPFLSGKGRVRSSPYSAKRGDRDAYPTNDDDTSFGPVCATVLKERLAACPTAFGGCDPRSGPEDRGLRPAGGGPGG